MSLCGCKVLTLYQIVEEPVPDCEWDTCWLGGINVVTIKLQNPPRLKLNTIHLQAKNRSCSAISLPQAGRKSPKSASFCCVAPPTTALGTASDTRGAIRT